MNESLLQDFDWQLSWTDIFFWTKCSSGTTSKMCIESIIINKAVNTPNSKETWSTVYISSARPRPRAEHEVNRKTLKETCEPTLHPSSSQQLTLQVTSLYWPQLIIAWLQPSWLVQEFSTKVALSFLRKRLMHLSWSEPQSLKNLALSPSRALFLQSSSVPLHS